MSYNSIIRKYLGELQKLFETAVRSGQMTDELSYRPVLDALFKELAREILPKEHLDIIFEPKNQGHAGRPDWRIHDSASMGIYGYIEAKGLTTTQFDIAPYEKQIERYSSLGHRLIITDGIDFVFCMTGSDSGHRHCLVSLVDKTRLAKSRKWGTLATAPNFELMMRRFFSTPVPQQCDESELVEFIALRTRLLADDILKYASISIEDAMDEEEKQAITILSGIRKLVYNHNDTNLRTDKVFADFTAQVIMFCLLYAHRVLCDTDDSPSVIEQKIKDFISDDLKGNEVLLPFRNLMVHIRDNAKQSFISLWIEECIKFLSFVKMTDSQLKKPDYHQLFEHFLASYDAKSRFDYGAYYTPRILADFVVKLTEQIVRKDFGGACLYSDGNTFVDPCCGTGSFLERIVAHDQGNAAYHLCGIEIMPAPYMLANYRMASIGRGRKKHKYTVDIILANTLNDCVIGKADAEDCIEGNELRRANEWVSKPIQLIIGNPPCSDSTRENIAEEFSAINVLMDDFRPPASQRHGRQNIQKQINNPYMQFLRWSCERLLSSRDNNVLSFIVPLSFLEAESYRYARKFLKEHFSGAWVVAVDADARTGARSDSMFHTLQGRAIIVLTRKYREKEGFCRFRHLDLAHMGMADKQAFLSGDILEAMGKFTCHDVDETNYTLAPAKPFDEKLYAKFWPVSSEDGSVAIFNNHCSGIKLAPTALFTHVKASMLRRRTKDIAVGGVDAAKPWFDRQDKKPSDAKISALKQALENCGGRENIDAMLAANIAPYSFRPYLQSNVLLWRDVLHSYARLDGGGTRERPEILKAYSDRRTFGFAMAHAPKDLNPTLSQFVSFCWSYPDNDMCTRGNSHIYMNLFPNRKNADALEPNVNADLTGIVSSLLNVDETVAVSKIIFYVYAILCSQVYLDEFEGALFTVNQTDKRARVPFVKDRKLFLEIAKLGEALATLEKSDFAPRNQLGLDYEMILSQLPSNFRLENSVHPFDEDNELLMLTDGRTRILIPCPLSLQKLNISGYDVIKNSWLKFNSYDFTNCEFTRDDLKGLLDFLNILATHENLIEKIDEKVHIVLGRNADLIPLP